MPESIKGEKEVEENRPCIYDCVETEGKIGDLKNTGGKTHLNSILNVINECCQ